MTAKTGGDGFNNQCPPSDRFWPLRGNWEGGTRDPDGNEWEHIPWQGWRLRPARRINPFLAPPNHRENA